MERITPNIVATIRAVFKKQTVVSNFMDDVVVVDKNNGADIIGFEQTQLCGMVNVSGEEYDFGRFIDYDFLNADVYVVIGKCEMTITFVEMANKVGAIVASRGDIPCVWVSPQGDIQIGNKAYIKTKYSGKLSLRDDVVFLTQEEAQFDSGGV
jgi:hypothetical protein